MKKILISLVIVSLIIGGAYFLNVKFKIIDNAFGLGTSEYKKESSERLTNVYRHNKRKQ